MRALLVAVLATLLVVPSPAAASATIPLAGITVVSAEESGRIRVTVPDDATVDAASFAAVTGEGRFFGVVLTRVGDETSFKASHLRFPADEDGFRHTSTSIRLDAADSDDPEPLNPLDVPTGRSCSSDCRLPAGDYDLLVVADGSPVEATVRIEGLVGTSTLGAASLAPLQTTQLTPDERAVDWGSLGSSGAGAGFWSSFHDARPALAYTMLASHVEADVAGRYDVSFCVTSDDECVGQSGRHVHAGNAVEGPERLTSFGSVDLPAGDHGLETQYGWDSVGGGSASHRYAVLFIHP